MLYIRIDVPIRNLMRHQLPKDNSKRPGDQTLKYQPENHTTCIYHRIKLVRFAETVTKIHRLPDVDLFRARFVADDLRRHPRHGSGERQCRTLLVPFATRSKVRNFDDVVVSNENTEYIQREKRSECMLLSVCPYAVMNGYTLCTSERDWRYERKGMRRFNYKLAMV